MPRAACLARDRGPLGVKGGKTHSEYMFSALSHIADIRKAAPFPPHLAYAYWKRPFAERSDRQQKRVVVAMPGAQRRPHPDFRRQRSQRQRDQGPASRDIVVEVPHAKAAIWNTAAPSTFTLSSDRPIRPIEVSIARG